MTAPVKIDESLLHAGHEVGREPHEPGVAGTEELPPEGVQAGALGAEPGAVAALVAHQFADDGPEAGAVVQLPQVGALMGGDVVGHLEGRERQAPGIGDRSGGPAR